MADDTQLGSAVGVGDKISTDDLGTGTKVQRVKAQFGADGTATDVSSANPLPVNQTGALPGGGNNIGDVDVLTLPANASVNMSQVAGTAVDVNSGAKSAGTQRIVIATDQPQLTTAWKVDGSAVTQPVSGPLTDAQLRASAVPVSLPGALAGIADDAAFGVASSIVLPVGYLADQAATDSVNEGDIGAARMTLDRIQIVTNGPSADTAGLSTSHLVSAATTNATVVKASPGKLHRWYIYNSHATLARKIAFHNASSAPTAGASIFFAFVIPPSSAANDADDIGIAFSTGIAFTTVTGLADSDNTAVGANDLIINLFFI